MAAAIVFDEESIEGIDLGDLTFDHLPLENFQIEPFLFENS